MNNNKPAIDEPPVYAQSNRYNNVLIRSIIMLAVGLSGTFTSGCTNPSTQSILHITPQGVFVPGVSLIRSSNPVNGDAAPSAPNPIENNAYLLTPSIWPTRTIPVCWEATGDSSSSDRDLVKSSVEGSWAANSSLKFIGWGQCPTNFNGIRIAVNDSGPHTKGLGRYLTGVKEGMVLNFTFHNWSESCQQMREMCIKSIAVHEFGHALGFAHEQNRPDTPGECAKLAQGTNGDQMLTSWDIHSVMNYCNPVYNNQGKLSRLDKQALQAIYGKA